MMAIKQKVATVVVTRVSKEQDQGLRSFERRPFGRESGIVPTGIASLEGILIIADSTCCTFSIWPFRASAVFQFVLLGILDLAVDGLWSVLFRLSSSCEVIFEVDFREVV
jgi:hypothetical protein